MNPLNHVAIIMDGNGRWGLKHKNSRNAGHKAGLNTVEKIIKETIKNKIKFLTLYAFSTENWKRPKKEINYLFSLLESITFPILAWDKYSVLQYSSNQNEENLSIKKAGSLIFSSQHISFLLK